jgi:hypothetical protein
MRLLILLLIASASVHAQVGFNNPNPHPSSILDLTANNKGLLIPRLTTAERDALTASAAVGLLVYDTSLSSFYFFNAGQWFALNEFVKTAGSNDVALSGNASVAGTLNASAVSSSTLNIAGFATNALVPTGAIMMWSGSVASIPAGWRLCDGSNGTPNLTDRFIVGAGNSYSPGNSGGQNTVTLSVNEMPAHTHSGTTSSDGLHSHTISYQVKDTRSQNTTGTWENGNNSLKPTSTDGLHSHSLNINSSGGNQPFDNRPAFWALAYIIKL